ncbi:MAG: DNRLRE domain-containing protein, partial [Clostridia bacterium]|nr:DNRLRE domain-containing protein [Clostridia bacterium]
MMKRFVSMAMAFLMAWSGGLLQLAEAYAASQPVIIEETEDYTIWQNADGTQTIRWLCTVEIPADPTQPEEWVEQGDSWSNEGAVARTTLRKNYVKNETLVTMSKDGASVSFAPIQIEEDLEQPQTEVAPSQQLSENQTVSNVLRIGAAGRRRPTRIEGRIRRGGLQSREAAPAVYEGLFDEHTDVHLTALSGGIKEDIVVNAYTGNHVYAFRMTLEGLSAQQKGQIIYLANGEGTIVAQIDAPYMFDASGAYSEDIAVSLVQEGGVYRLTYVPSDAWMKNAVYPVTIDPSGNYLNDLATGIGDVYVSSGQPNHRYDHMVPSGSAQLDYSLEGNNLMVGNRSGSNYYAYIWPTLRGTFDANSSPFPNASNILIRSASWNFQMHDGTSSNQRFNAHLITRSWDVTNLTYNNRPTETSKVYASGTIGSGWNRFDMTELFGAWFDTLGGQMQNFGFVLKAAEGRANDYRRLYSADIRPRTMRMYFEATYYTDPARPNVTITAGDYGVNSESGFVNLSWNAVTGADGYVLGIHNGQAYDYRYIGNVTSYTTQGKGLWPTTAQMAAGQNGIRWDGTGRELPNVPRVTSTDLNYYFRVIPTNRFGQASSSASAADRSIVLPDTTPPNQPATVTVNPATWSNAATMAVTWSGVTDLPVNTGNLGTGRIQYVIDPSPLLTDPKDWPWVNTTSNLPNGSFTFSTDGLLDGTHTIYVRGMDARGNYGAPGGAEFKVDKTPPTAPIVSVDPAPPVWTNANTASLTWSGIEDLDANLPLARVECRFGTGTWINTGQTGQSYSGYPLDISQLDGPQTVSVRGVDRAGNDGLPGTATVNVDRSPPIFDTAGITPSFWTALNEVEFAWQGATDTYSGLDTLAYAINNENEVALAATEDGTATINIAHLADGQHTLHFLLTDKVGNEHGEEITIYVDRTDPVIALLAPDDGEWISGITEVWGSISDLSIKTWTLTVTGEDGVDRQISSGTDNRVPQILGRLNAGLFADGEQVRLTLYAEDHAGNHSTVTGVYLVVDKSVKPIVSNIEITTPTSGQALTTAKAEGSYDIQYAEPESETFIYVDGKYVHDARAGQLFDLYPILYQENALHTVTAVSLDTVGGVHFSQGLGAYSLLSDAFADNSLLADYTGVSFSDSGDGALGAGSLTSITATSPKPLVAFRLHAAEQGSISYEYQTEGGTWTSVDPGKYVVFKTPVYSLQTRAVLASGAVLHGWEIEGVVELNPVRFISQLEKKAEALRIVESQVNRALPVLTTTPAPQLVAQVQFVNGEQEKDDFVLDALRTQEGGRLPVALLGEDAQGTLYAAESPASATLLREVLPAPQSEEIRTLTSTGDLYALRLVPWSDGAAPAYTYSVDNGATWAALLPDAYTVLSKASKEVQIKATMPVGSVLKAWHIEGVTATPKNITVRILQAPQNVIAADYGAYPPAQQKTVISWTDPNTADPTLGNANVTVVLKNGI